jgi:hypothetical protein
VILVYRRYKQKILSWIPDGLFCVLKTNKTIKSALHHDKKGRWRRAATNKDGKTRMRLLRRYSRRTFSSPKTELGTSLRLDTILNRNNYIEVVVFDLAFNKSITLRLNYCKFRNSCLCRCNTRTAEIPRTNSPFRCKYNRLHPLK